jgi:hemin uptake protein HemP
LIDDLVRVGKNAQRTISRRTMTDDQDETRGSEAARPRGNAPRMISSRDILGDDRFVVIRHEDALYRLQRTAAGKLILTK